MSLPAPNLDDRSFQEIVDDAKQQIARRCPEWTDHNVSDPGVTLIELFAWMTETTLYRLNQVPEKNYIKFLEMIGVALEPPAPARTDLRFRLSRPIEDQDGEEAYERTLRARETVAATVRTEYEEAVEFSTDADLRLVRPRLRHILRVSAADAGADSTAALSPERDFLTWRPQMRDGGGEAGAGTLRVGFPIFSPVPQEGDALYLGFESDVSGNLVELEVDCVQAAATALDEQYPAQRWEVWNGIENCWDALVVRRDTTFGFNRPPGQIEQGEPTGLIELPLPRGLITRQIAGRPARWVRCVYTTKLPPRPSKPDGPAAYQKSPEIMGITARVVGGTAPASHCTAVTHRDLGQSDGTPGQVFSMGQAPILERRLGETVLVGELGAPWAEWEVWEEVTDFAESGAEDRHFVCDSFAGEILFGPSILQPDGSARQHGAVPRKGLTIVFSQFRHGGGTRGNVAAEQVRVLKSSIPYISDVTNPRRADGGREQETLERAKLRGRALLRLRDRAVTAEDYEFLARRASSAVGRARCIQPRRLHDPGREGERIPPGVVRVLLIPALDETVRVPRPADLRVPDTVRQEVEAYLDERRLLTTVLEVGEPKYVFVSTEITMVPDPKQDADQVARRVRESLEEYIHPLRGGPSGDGWIFQRALTLSDIYARVQAASGVAFLLDVRLFVAEIINPQEGLLSPERPIPDLRRGVSLQEHEMLCTREHRIIPRPMWVVGTEEARLG